MWSRVPLLRLIIPFITGIVLSVRLNLIVTDHIYYFLAFLVIILSLFFGLLFSYWSRWVYGVCVILFFVLCGLSFVQSEKQIGKQCRASIREEPKIYLVELNEAFELRERSCRSRISLVAAKDSSGWSNCDGDVMLYTEPDSTLPALPVGSYFMIYASLSELRPPGNPEEFDYKKYLSHQGIFHSSYLKKGEWKICRLVSSFNIRQYASSLRSQLLDKLSRNGLNGAEFGLSAALLLGDDSHLDADVRDVYSRAGAMHILCVSGLHVGVVFLVLSTLLGFLKRFRMGRILLPFLLIVCIWFYALITGLAPPVVRASCMLSFIIVGKGLRRQTNVYNTLSAAALLMLMLDPFILFSAGFQLSFAAVLGIVSLQQPLFKTMYFRYRIPNSIWAITTVSIAAQLGTLPIVLYYFHQLPVYGLLTNFVVIPLASFIIYCGAIIFLIPFGDISILIAYVLKFLISIMDGGVGLVESLPNAVVSGVSIDEWMAYTSFLLIIGFCGFLISKRKLFLILGLLSLLFLSGYRIHKRIKQNAQKSMIVYAVTRHSGIDIINGPNHIFMADSALLTNEKILSYSIRPNWLALGLKDAKVLIINNVGRSESGGDFIRPLPCNNFRCAILQGSLPPSPGGDKLKLDFLIMRGRFSFQMSHLLAFFDVGMLIIDASVPPWETQKLKESDTEIDIWDVREKGAFILNY